MKLTNFTDYSLRALIYLAVHPGRLCTVNEISESFDISYNHMAKVAHNLSQLGYIEGSKGKGGGLSLAKPADQLNLSELIREIEPNFNVAVCFNADSSECCITPVCQLKHVFDDAYKAFINELGKYTLADITSNKEGLLTFFKINKHPIL